MTRRPSQNTGFCFVLLFCLIAGLYTYVSAQDIDPTVDVIMLKDGYYTGEKYDAFAIQVTNSPDHGDMEVHYHPTGDYISYEPDPGYTGLDELQIEVRLGVPGQWYIYYVTYRFLVKPSIVTVNDDFFTIPGDSDYQFLDVLANDSSTAGILALADVPAVGDGSVYISNDSLYFKPKSGFAGLSYLAYLACDDLGDCALGLAHLDITDPAGPPDSDTIHLMTQENRSLREMLPAADFAVIDAPELGSVSFFNGTAAFRYQPFSNIHGKDTFLLANSQYERLFIVEIFDLEQGNSFVIDDYVFTPINDSVFFNVLTNDANDNFNVHSHTGVAQGELEKLDNDGNFLYVPPTGFEGLVTYRYKICAFNNCEYGNVYIFVGNLSPENGGNYKLTTNKNRPLVVNYDVPITNFSFEILNAPGEGTLEIYQGVDTLAIGCEDIIGHNLVVYTPGQDFVGEDEFELEYCAGSNGYCQVVKVEIEVVDLAIDSVCACVDDCVWPGDIDYDGRVDMYDLLLLGLDVGATGVVRPFVEMDTWIGQYCEDWDASGFNPDATNMKHADTDGDGAVKSADTLAISKFYNKVHTFVAEKNYLLKNYDIRLELDDTVYQAGDLVTAEIVVGSADNPVPDLHGLALNYAFDPILVDTSTIRAELYMDSWLARQSVSLDLIKQEGRILDLGLTRTGLGGATGFGSIGKIDFIIDDDLEGFRPGGRYLPLDIELKSGIGMTADGESYQVPTVSQRILVDLIGDEEEPEEEDALSRIYPNPTSGVLQVESIQPILKLEVFNLNGQLVEAQLENGAQKAFLNLRDFAEGIYLVRIETAENVEVLKFSIQR